MMIPESTLPSEQLQATARETMARQNLLSMLHYFGLPLDRWGQGDAKTFGDLFREVQEGETTFVWDDKGFRRRLNVVSIDVVHRDRWGQAYYLVESHQQFPDGRVRQRSLPFSISEKMKSGEKPIAAMSRALDEELGISIATPLTHVSTEASVRMSSSYPGLLTEAIAYGGVAIVQPEAFDPAGYVENRDGLTTHFVWQEVTT